MKAFLLSGCLLLSTFVISQAQTAEAYFKQAKKLYKVQQKYLEAIARINKAIALDSSQAKYYFHRAIFQDKLGNSNQFLEDMHRALALSPKNDWYYQNRAVAYTQCKKYSLALKDINQAIQLDYLYHILKGDIYSEMQEYLKAVKCYDQAIKFNPKHAQAYNKRGLAKRNLDLYQEALIDYNQAIALNPNDPDPYCNRGAVQWRLSHSLLALQDYQKALQLDPQDANTYYNRGILYYHEVPKNTATRKDNTYKALQNFNKSIELDSSLVDVYLIRGKTYVLLGKNQKALADFKKAKALALKEPKANAKILKKINEELQKF